MAKRKTTTKKAVPVSAAKKDPCAEATKSKKLQQHLQRKPAADDPCFQAWRSHAAWLAHFEGVRLGPM